MSMMFSRKGMEWHPLETDFCHSQKLLDSIDSVPQIQVIIVIEFTGLSYSQSLNVSFSYILTTKEFFRKYLPVYEMSSCAAYEACCSITWYSTAMCVSSLRPLYLGSNLTKFSSCQNIMINWREAIINEGFLWLIKAPQIANNEYSISKKAFSIPNAIREAEILSKILTLLNTFELSKWL